MYTQAVVGMIANLVRYANDGRWNQMLLDMAKGKTTPVNEQGKLIGAKQAVDLPKLFPEFEALDLQVDHVRPRLFLTSEKDGLIASSRVKEYVERMRNYHPSAPVRLVEFTAGAHCQIFASEGERIGEELAAFITEVGVA